MSQEINEENIESFPMVSVTIPSYNAGSTLAETLDSVLSQTYPNIEIIVIDDGSTDNTQEILDIYSERVISIRQNNGGLASARNAGCLKAQGKYVALLDADDLCTPERIAMQVTYMEMNPEFVMCSSDFSTFNSSGFIADSYIANYYSRIEETTGGLAGIYSKQTELNLNGFKVKTYSGNVYEQIAVGSFVHPPTVLFRRNILEECGLVDEKIVNCCDFEWFVRMSRTGSFGFIDRPLLKYRFSENQMSGTQNSLQMSLDIVQVMEKTFATDPTLLKSNSEFYLPYLANAYLDAANFLADSNPLVAIKKLFRSVALGGLRPLSFKVLCKVFVPLQLLRWKRNRSNYSE